MVKKRALLLVLLVAVIGGLAIFTNQGENNGEKKELSNSLLSIGDSMFSEKEYDLENFLITENSYVEINGVKVSADRTTPVNIGDVLDVHLEWSLPNTLTFTTSDTFVLQFPDTLTFDEVENGPIKDGTETVGYYSVVNNTVTLKYTNEDFLNQSNITGTLNLSGRVTEKTAGSIEGGKVDLEIPGVGTIPVYVQPDGSLSINKTITNKIDTDTYEYKLEVKSIKENTEVIIGDNLGEYLHLKENTVKIEKNGIDITKDVKVYYNQLYGNDIIDFIFMLDKMEDGDVVTVTYQIDVDEKGFIWDYNDGNNQYQTLVNLTNLAGVMSKENPTWVFDSVTVETEKSAAAKYGNYKDGKVDWTIYVLPGEKGVTLNDIIGDNQTIDLYSLMPGGYLYVYETDLSTGQGIVSKLKITPEDLIKGYTFAPDSTGNKQYMIYYKTIPTDQGIYEGKVNNKIVISLGDSHYEHDAIAQIGVPVIYKQYVDANDIDKVLSWNSVLTAPENGLKNTVFHDILGTGLTLIEDSIKINGTAIGETGYKFSKTDYGFEINFGNINLGDIFNISYDTTFDDSATTVFVNTAEVTADGVSVSDDAYYEYNNKSNYITKYVDNKGTVNEDGEHSGIVSWQIDVDQMPNGATKSVITDILPEGMEYVEGTAKLVLNKNPWTTYSLNPTIENGVVTIDISEYIDLIQGDNGVSVFLETKLKELQTESKTYTNKAYITIDDKKYPEVSASIDGEITSIIEKDAVYTPITAPEVEYTINLNKGSFDIDPNSDTLVLEDNMGTALAFVMGSLKINDEVWNNYDWNPDTRKLTITVPDEQSLKITYNAFVNLSPGEELTNANAYNQVNLYGFNENYTEDEHIIVGDVLESSATSSGEGKTIRLYKYKDGIRNNPMKGAEFALIDCEYEGSEDTFKFTGKETLVDTLVTGDDGYASYSGLAFDHVYKLVETKTNEGYILDDEEYYFVYPGNDGTVYPENISQKTDTWTYYINNNYSKTNLEVEKSWDDNNNKDRPSYVTVYLKQNGNYVLDNGNKVFKVLNDDNNWNASFENLDKYDNNGNLYNYTVEEDVPVNYEASYNYTDGVNVKNVNITNTLTKGSLTVSKTVGGTAGEQDRDFTFKIELFDENNNALIKTFNYTGSKSGSITSGGTITLKHGESITIDELPAGAKYKVTELEANTDGYETTVTNNEGTVNLGTQTAAFVNTKNEELGSLSVSKTVGGTAGEQDRDFTFKIELFDENNSALTESFNYIGSKTGSITSGESVTLKHGESITIEGLPVGTKYKVTELEANTDGYETTSTNDSGTITKENKAVSFINTKNEKPTDKLTISKTVGGTAGEQDRDFTFKIELFDENITALTESFNYTGSKTGSITSGESVTLKHGESITIEGLPVGTKYKVTELEANTDGYETTVTNNEGTILENGAIVNFVNTKNELPKGSLTLNKIVSGNAGEQDRDFTFKIELFDENNTVLTESFDYKGSKTGIITSGESVTLKHGESITIEGLPVGTKYKVTELEANTDGYTTTSENDNGIISEGNQIVSFENNKIEILVVNGFLTINKIVTGDGDKNKDFIFKVEFTDENGNNLTNTFAYAGSKVGTIVSGGTVTLKHGESITIIGLPVGTKYKVTELEANTNGYTTTSENSEGIIDKNGKITTFTNNLEKAKKQEKTLYIPKTGVKDNTSIYGILAFLSATIFIILYRRKDNEA